MSQDEKNVAIRYSKKDEDSTIFIYCRFCFSSWCRNIDHDEILTKPLDGCYTRMLRMTLNMPWKSYLANNNFYGELPKVLTKVQQVTASITLVSLVLYKLFEGRTRRGRRRVTFIDVLLEDTGMMYRNYRLLCKVEVNRKIVCKQQRVQAHDLYICKYFFKKGTFSEQPLFQNRCFLEISNFSQYLFSKESYFFNYLSLMQLHFPLIS